MTIKAILIDPATQSVEWADLTGDRAIAGTIGCDLFTYVGITPSIGMYLDDEGLIRGNPAERGFFTLYGCKQVLCGRALVCNHDPDGELTSDGLPSLASIRRNTTWLTHQQAYELQKQLDTANRSRILALEKEFGVPIISCGNASDMIGDPNAEPQEG